MGLFTHVKLNPHGPAAAKVKVVEDQFDFLLRTLEPIVPAGRELALLKTKLQEACFWAKKGICEAEENQGQS